MKLYTDRDIETPPLRGRRVAVIGFGSQGRAQAENLRDSGVHLVVGLRDGSSSTPAALAAGFDVRDIASAVRWADLTALLIPDESHPAVFESRIRPALADGKTLLFAHGFSVHFGFLSPPPGVDVVMVSPKGPGARVRSEYTAGRGLVMLAAVGQDSSGGALGTALEYAAAIGGGRAGIIECTFGDECETDLFGEQAVICGGLSHLILAGFETLVEAGYPPELAYFECLHEAKFVADLIQSRGIAGMRKAISNTARYGDLTRGPRVVGPAVRDRMREVLAEIRSGFFAREWMGETRSGHRTFNALMARESEHPIEESGRRLRDLFRGGKGGEDR